MSAVVLWNSYIHALPAILPSNRDTDPLSLLF